MTFTVIKQGFIPARYVISIMCGFGLLISYFQRGYLGQVIVSMVNHTAIADTEEPVIPCGYLTVGDDNSTNSTTALEEGSLVWDEHIQGLVLSCFYWGYITVQLPGGWIVNKVGGKWPLALGMAVAAVMMFLGPVAAMFDWRLFLVLRILQGCGNGFVFVCCTTILAKWVPSSEKNLLLNIAFSGANLGTALNFSISSFLTKYAGGWPSVLYGFGLLCIIWIGFWIFLVYESPAVHPRISFEEKTYLEKALGKNVSKKDKVIPWKAILLSKPVWALNVVQFLTYYGLYTFMTNLPSYIAKILGFPIIENGNLMMTAYLIQFVLFIITSYVADKLHSKQILTQLYIRKGSFTISLSIVIACLLGITYVGCNKVAVCALFFIAIGILGFDAVGENINYADIGPEFPGILMAIQTLFATSAGISAPIVVGIITQKQNTIPQWNKAFRIAAAMYGLALIIFNVFGSVEPEPWNYENENPTFDTECKTTNKDNEEVKESQTTVT